jgi:hypothetical protein
MRERPTDWTMVRFHQERLADAGERAAQWRAVLDALVAGLEDRPAVGPPP